MATRKDFMEVAASAGVTVDYAAGTPPKDDTPAKPFHLLLEAPPRKLFAGQRLHRTGEIYGRPGTHTADWAESLKTLRLLIARGFEDCPDPKCEYCSPEAIAARRAERAAGPKSPMQRKVEELKVALERLGFKPVGMHGHLQKAINGSNGRLPGVIRAKFQPTSVRLEIKWDYPRGHVDYGVWVKRDGAYYKDLVVTEEGIKLDRGLLKFPKAQEPSC
jgi:hypothetical protein